jgi:hypothetical protein
VAADEPFVVLFRHDGSARRISELSLVDDGRRASHNGGVTGFT